MASESEGNKEGTFQVRVLHYKNERYLNAQDVKHLILELAGSEETDVRNRLETLANSLSPAQ